MNIIPIAVKENINKNDIEVVQKEQQEYHLIGSFLRTRGLRLFTYNPKDDLISEIKVEKEKIVTTAIDPLTNSLVMNDRMSKEKCLIDTRNIPFEALNPKNAQKRVGKFKRGEIGSLYNLTKCL